MGAVAFSAILHAAAIAAFAAWPEPGGQQAAGDDGTVTITLIGSDAALAALADAWSPTAEPVPVLDPPPETTLTEPVAAPAMQPPPPVETPAPPETAIVDAPPDVLAPEPPPVAAPPAETGEAPAPAPDAPAVAALRPLARPRDLALLPRPAPVTIAEPPAAPPPGNGRADLQAQGAGGGAAAGAAGAMIATGQGGDAAKAINLWRAEIQRKLQRDLTNDITITSGRVDLVIRVTLSGALTDAAVARSSGSAAIDTQALRALRRAGRLPPAPPGLAQGSYSFTIPILFAD